MKIQLPKKALVTGGAGFLGSHLCRRLLADGYEVTALDNLFTGTKKNIYDLLDNRRFSFVLHDITQPFWGQFDEIYNLACPASPVHYQHNPVETMKTSVVGMMNMLELAMKTKAKILHASTSEVYGDPLVHPQVEKYWGNVNTIGIRSCYDEGKRCAESLFFDYHRHEGVDIKIVRIFNTYGPHMDPNDGRVVSNFICQALSGQDITIYGTGSQTRSFCYVDDLIDILIKVMNAEKDFTGPVNIGNPGEFTIKELAEKVISKINGTVKVIYKDLPSDDPTQRKPDIPLAKTKFGWEPKIMLDEVNKAGESAKGNVVFITDKRFSTVNVNFNVRCVYTEDHDICGAISFNGFINGLMAGNSDIEYVFIDGLKRIIGNDMEDGEKLFESIEQLQEEYKELKFVISVSGAKEELPSYVTKFID